MQTITAPAARSLLFVPGHQGARFDKACASGADAIVLDLEDAVPPARKEEARAQVAQWLDALPDDPHRALIAMRINGADTTWYAEDAALCAHPRVAAIMLPKAEDAGVLRHLAMMLPGKWIWPLVETACGIARLDGLAAAPQVQRLVFGTIDFQAEMDIEADEDHGDELLFYRAQIVLTSRLAGLQAPVDGVSTVLDAPTRVEAQAHRARRLGFGGKLCIHPAQVAAVNTSFSPTVAQLDWARRVITADAASAGAPIAVDGKMVDQPVVLKAQALLRAAQR